MLSIDDRGRYARRDLLGAAMATAAFPAGGLDAGAVRKERDAGGNAIRPAHIAFKGGEVRDLLARLACTRWPDKETVPDWSQGVPLADAKRLIDHWRHRYDFSRIPNRLNVLPQFRTSLSGINIYFLHIKSRHPNSLPIVLTHGWPSSIIEFIDVIAPLADPTSYGGSADEAFDIVVPALPGFPFSEKPSAPGWGISRIAEAWSELMARLGYGRWVAHGGDWGAAVTMALGSMAPPGLIGIHLSDLIPPRTLPTDASPGERDAYLETRRTKDIGYAREQMSRPQTIGYSLADSPVGLATWIFEKLNEWTSTVYDAAHQISLDKCLDEISAYWFTDTAASSARIYWEVAQLGIPTNPVTIPVSVSLFRGGDNYDPPETAARRAFPTLVYFNDVPEGGHFAPLKSPLVFARELRQAVAGMR